MPCTRCAHGDRPSLGREARAARGGALQTNHRVRGTQCTRCAKAFPQLLRGRWQRLRTGVATQGPGLGVEGRGFLQRGDTCLRATDQQACWPRVLWRPVHMEPALFDVLCDDPPPPPPVRPQVSLLTTADTADARLGFPVACLDTSELQKEAVGDEATGSDSAAAASQGTEDPPQQPPGPESGSPSEDLEPSASETPDPRVWRPGAASTEDRRAEVAIADDDRWIAMVDIPGCASGSGVVSAALTGAAPDADREADGLKAQSAPESSEIAEIVHNKDLAEIGSAGRQEDETQSLLSPHIAELPSSITDRSDRLGSSEPGEAASDPEDMQLPKVSTRPFHAGYQPSEEARTAQSKLQGTSFPLLPLPCEVLLKYFSAGRKSQQITRVPYGARLDLVLESFSCHGSAGYDAPRISIRRSSSTAPHCIAPGHKP